MPTVIFKTCSKCGRKKPVSEYHKQNRKDTGQKARCRECALKIQHEYQHSEIGKMARKQYNDRYLQQNSTKINMRKTSLRLKFGITLDNYNQMFAEQNGCCAICGTHQSEFKNALAVDHNHKTNRIRGLLCVRCNTKLSFLEDETLMEKATAYLAKHATAG